MFKKLRGEIISALWEEFVGNISFYKDTFPNRPALDHLAIVDLTVKGAGINHLKEVLTALGFVHRGSGYLPEKQNDFIWLTAEDSAQSFAKQALPQIVLGDFRLEELSPALNKVLRDCATSSSFDLERYKALAAEFKQGKKQLYNKLFDAALGELNHTPWRKPTKQEYEIALAENQLIAWILLFGRKINHFGVGIHLDNRFNNLNHFNDILKSSQITALNNSSGEIKGGKYCGIEQSASLGREIEMELFDGHKVMATDSFMEFVWRFSDKPNPIAWNDYFTDFVAVNANTVIESLYNHELMVK